MRMVVGVSAVSLFLTNVFVLRSLEVRYLAVALAVLWVVLTVVQLAYVSRARSRMGQGQPYQSQ